MGDVINFNKAKKVRAKADARVTADANRAKFGRSKAEKAHERLEKVRAERLLDGAKLDGDS